MFEFLKEDSPWSTMRLQSLIVTLTACLGLLYLTYRYNIWEALITALVISFAGKSIQKAVETGAFDRFLKLSSSDPAKKDGNNG
jgi:galactitol-specific phosphotransferase system IIC component